MLDCIHSVDYFFKTVKGSKAKGFEFFIKGF